MAQLVRRNQALLSEDQRKDFVTAVWGVKSGGHYDEFVKTHVSRPDSYHHVPTFLPWHREFVRIFEVALPPSTSGQTLSVPYWDWTDTGSSPWTDDFMGGNGRAGDDRVMTGRFAISAGWNCIDPSREIPSYLRRQFGAGVPHLPTAGDVSDCLAMTPYDSEPWEGVSQSFRKSLEGVITPDIHNMVHRWIGGNMELTSSPNDPVFWLHHANIDRLWAQWQREHPTETYRPQSGGPPGQNVGDLMPPWSSVRVSAVLDHRSLGYVYDIENPTAQGDRMYPGDTLRGGDSISAGGGRYRLVYETDGNLVLYQDGEHTPRWSSGTQRRSPGMCVMQMDGDLTIDDADGQRVWSLGVDGRGNRLRLTADGAMEVTGLSGAIAWRSTHDVMV
ncbi:tyrosinase family protein [Streptomyces genisteinicus]|uniref:Tyrosinase family protein n=1 Tax=Streptomyces genisteinicus TaxID=2768068 RepID=A0A7H0HS39_9ACTN|nr:tyrosinase family protein [Streptomyces genisteinicus]QNP63355.1 tyrosinase family protein [Streptomyces genisteinicus]